MIHYKFTQEIDSIILLLSNLTAVKNKLKVTIKSDSYRSRLEIRIMIFAFYFIQYYAFKLITFSLHQNFVIIFTIQSKNTIKN